MKVLVIDDDPAFVKKAKIDLERCGADVWPHIGSRGALAAGWKSNPDLVLLDLNMPGLSGTWLLSELRKQCPRARILFCSDSEPSTMKRLARLVGADGAISKSELGALTAESLRALVERKHA
jgi:DNA-binding NarL/FixJ family response regulator